jgi:hypothetical protein
MFSLKKWNFGATTIYSTGRPYYIDNSPNNKILPITRVAKQLPNYFRSDVSCNYNFTIKNVRLKTGATIINIFNTKNYLDVNTRKFDFDNASFSETNVIPAQLLSFNLFVHFVF